MNDSWEVDGVCGTSNRYSDVTWATGFTSPAPAGTKISRYGQANGWDNARNYYYDALTSTNPIPGVLTRDGLFARAFRSLGMVVHLLQDMAVPAHVRNDMKSHLWNAPNPKIWINPFERYVSKKTLLFRNIGTVKPVFSSPAKLTDFWDTNIYNGNEPEITKYAGIGLAEYTNANFLSDFTIFNQNPTAKHYFPYPSESSVSIGTKQIANPFKPGTTVSRQYYVKTSDGEVSYLLAGVDYLTVVTAPNPPYVETIPPLDNNVHADYAQLLLPRAVGYSSALLDYFFRGTLAISSPAQQVYGIIDGSILPQQFRNIKAKVKNSTPNEQITSGSLVAIAQYKVDANYQPDLSSNPSNNSANPLTYAASAPVTMTAAQLATINTTPTEFTFDFSASPIPAGITDLSLQVVFKGTLGNETNTAVAVGLQNISEPTHHVFWNATDMFSLEYNLYTTAQIKAVPQLAPLADTDQDSIFNEPGEPYIDPYALDFEIAYSANSQQTAPTLVTATVPPGRHLRLIGLFDTTTPNYVDFYYGNSGATELSGYKEGIVGAVAENGTGSAAITTHRVWNNSGSRAPFRQHYHVGIVGCKPLSTRSDGSTFCAYPEEQSITAEKLPYPADPIPGL